MWSGKLIDDDLGERISEDEVKAKMGLETL